jgi:hypothetical protein
MDIGSNGGYNIELEDRQWLRATQSEPVVLMRGDQPLNVDPRQSPLSSNGFLQVENQKSIGACCGVSGSDTGEFAFAHATGEVIQFDWMHAYIGTQIEDGINGDRGATLSGFTKYARKGLVPTKSNTYPDSYPGRRYITDEMESVRSKYVLASHSECNVSDEVRAYIASNLGIVHIGMPWGSAMQPDSLGCIDSWYTTVRDGGHAWVICGYCEDSIVRKTSGAGWWHLCKNSWTIKWGLKGYFYVKPKDMDKILAHKFTSCYGRSDMKTPIVRPSKFDFSKNSVFG